VDCILPPGEEEPHPEEEDATGAEPTRLAISELRENVREIRRVEERVRMLESGQTPSE
jgi:hypothetical protein